MPGLAFVSLNPSCVVAMTLPGKEKSLPVKKAVTGVKIHEKVEAGYHGHGRSLDKLDYFSANG